MHDKRSFEERLTDLQKELVEICKKYDIEITAALRSTPQSIIATIIFLDLNNDDILKKYGLTRTAKPVDTADGVPLNPLKN